jgi:hypothetical protein
MALDEALYSSILNVAEATVEFRRLELKGVEHGPGCASSATFPLHFGQDSAAQAPAAMRFPDPEHIDPQPPKMDAAK